MNMTIISLINSNNYFVAPPLFSDQTVSDLNQNLAHFRIFHLKSGKLGLDEFVNQLKIN